MTDAAIDISIHSMGSNEFRLFRDLIHHYAGIWLRDNKQIMLASRLARRLREHGMSSFADYYEFVRLRDADGRELVELLNCVTTNKTAFFRERHHFEFLSTAVEEVVSRSQVARKLQESYTETNKTIRIWSAACSTGEEPYSIAITLLEKQADLRARKQFGWNFRIIASDIDTNVLAKAQRGVYQADALGDIDPALCHKYFLRGKGEMAGYVRVKEDATDLVEFRRINLMDTVWQLNEIFDFVFLRNALIYFKQETQDAFLRKIVRHMRPGGILFLGHSEHIPWLHDILEPLSNTVYRLRGATSESKR